MYYQSMTTSTAVRLDAIRRVGKALADPTRAAILLALLDGSRYPAELVDELGVTKQTVSNHLACLRDCGLLDVRHEGRSSYYRLAHPEATDELLATGARLVGLAAPEEVG